jgi:hypothetical protein
MSSIQFSGHVHMYGFYSQLIVYQSRTSVPGQFPM